MENFSRDKEIIQKKQSAINKKYNIETKNSLPRFKSRLDTANKRTSQ